jgi:hypothetical protein
VRKSPARRLLAAAGRPVRVRLSGQEEHGPCFSIVDSREGSPGGSPSASAPGAAGEASGRAVHLPPGTYNHSGSLTADGVNIVGAGSSTVLHATSSTGAAVVLTGNNASLSNVATTVSASQPMDAAILVQNAKNAKVTSVSVQGASSNGIRLDNADSCTVSKAYVNGSNADGIALVNARLTTPRTTRTRATPTPVRSRTPATSSTAIMQAPTTNRAAVSP